MAVERPWAAPPTAKSDGAPRVLQEVNFDFDLELDLQSAGYHHLKASSIRITCKDPVDWEAMCPSMTFPNEVPQST